MMKIKEMVNKVNPKAFAKKMYVGALTTAVMLYPTTSFAAGDPTAIAQNVLNKIGNFFMIISPSLGAVAFMALGTMYKMTTQSHKKSEYAGHMKSTMFTVALVLSAGAIMKWIATMVK